MIIKGDVDRNSKITLDDILLLNLASEGKISLNSEQIQAGDIDNNGVINSNDVELLKKHKDCINIITEVV